MRGRTRGVVVISVCAAVVAGCADKDEKTVAGRTTSASTAPSTTLVAALRRTRVVEAGTGATTARLAARVEAPDARAAWLRAPTQEELPLEALAPGVFAAELEGDEALLAARFPRGGYTWVLDLAAGRDATATVLLRDAPPPPTLLAPTDLALVAVDALVVRWAGDAERHDVRIVDVASGDEVHAARDLTGRHHVVPAGVLSAGLRYRVEVLAADGPLGAATRASSGVAVLVDGAP